MRYLILTACLFFTSLANGQTLPANKTEAKKQAIKLAVEEAYKCCINDPYAWEHVGSEVHTYYDRQEKKYWKPYYRLVYTIGLRFQETDRDGARATKFKAFVVNLHKNKAIEGRLLKSQPNFVNP